MKKIVITMLVVMVVLTSVFAFTACNKSDAKNIEDREYFVCGITYYAPMNYLEGDKLVGFDTELAQAVAEVLDLEVKFQLINWDSKFLELNSGAIDCIWNGFTVDEERKENVDFSKSYLNNSQCIVVKASKASLYTSKESFSGKKSAAEAGSAGADYAKEYAGEANYTDVDSQMKALTEVNAGNVDFAVVDVTLAKANVGNGDYASLAIIDNSIASIEPEEYAIGFRKGSDFTAKVNQALATLYANGKIAEIAAKYGLSNALIPIE